MTKFRRKPMEVEAIQVEQGWRNIEQINEFIGARLPIPSILYTDNAHKPDGVAYPDHWYVRDAHGVLSIWSDKAFREEFEAVPE